MALAIAIVSLVAAWGLSNRPFNSPDEPAHYLRALALTQGKVASRAPRRDRRKLAFAAQPAGFNPGPSLDIVMLNTRTLRVSASKSPPPHWSRCVNGRPDTGTGSCTEATYVGSYPPLSYILPALGIAASGSTATAIWLGRLGTAVQCAAFLLLAGALSLRGGAGLC